MSELDFGIRNQETVKLWSKYILKHAKINSSKYNKNKLSRDLKVSKNK